MYSKKCTCLAGPPVDLRTREAVVLESSAIPPAPRPVGLFTIFALLALLWKKAPLTAEIHGERAVEDTRARIQRELPGQEPCAESARAAECTVCARCARAQHV